MAQVRTYVKAPLGRTVAPSMKRLDAERVRIDWREIDGTLVASEILPNPEVGPLALELDRYVLEAPPADTTPPIAAALSGTVGNGSISLSWTHSGEDLARWEVWLDNHWAAQLPASARTWSKEGLTPGVPVTVRIVAYDAAGNWGNSNPVTLTPTGVVSGAGLPPEPAGWRRIFSDDFAIPVALGQFPAAAPKWGAYPSSWMDTMKHGYYEAPSVVSIHDGMMDIWCHTKDGRRLVAAPFPRLPQDPSVQIGPTSQHAGGSFTSYLTKSARIAVRVKADPMPGYKTAWLLWPGSDEWPRDGEIDCPEGDLRPGSHVSGFMHRQNGADGSDQESFGGAFVYADGQWHTYVTEWRAGESCQFFIDDHAGPRWTSRVPATPMRYVMQTETELTDTMPAPEVQGHVYVDWITYAVAA